MKSDAGLSAWAAAFLLILFFLWCWASVSLNLERPFCTLSPGLPFKGCCFLCHSGHGGSCLADAPVELCVKWEGVWDGWAQINKVMDDIQFMVIDADGWGRVNVLFCFCKLMVSPKSWQALLKRVMSCCRSLAEWAFTAASSAKRKSRRHLSWALVLALSLERLKSFPSVLVRRYIPSAAGPNACFSITA